MDKQNLMLTNEGPKSTIDLLFICSLSAVYQRDEKRSLSRQQGKPLISPAYRFPGHALHEKGSQKQKGGCPLVSSQE